MIADAKICDARADRFDDASPFVARNDGHRMLRRAGHQVIITVANPRRRDAHQHFVCAGLLEIQLVNLKRRACFLQNGGGYFHGLPSIFCVARIVGRNESNWSGCALPHVVLRYPYNFAFFCASE